MLQVDIDSREMDSKLGKTARRREEELKSGVVQLLPQDSKEPLDATTREGGWVHSDIEHKEAEKEANSSFAGCTKE
ncbi:hypothetical protein NPIL_551 [Nephila pilipes]|uniref:Uncharacterized protein n=1 Tax=Nephila pilipes TaxID=299642 RepID=A0A8X6QXK5_NEPPI|nr:hypothetical protein NPIL_551 [Nephila pilipes]